MDLAEFDAMTARMRLAFEQAVDLGQHEAAAGILYQADEQLPPDLRIEAGEPGSAEAFVREHGRAVWAAVAEYRQRLATF